jgi:hypothetical protein
MHGVASISTTVQAAFVSSNEAAQVTCAWPVLLLPLLLPHPTAAAATPN